MANREEFCEIWSDKKKYLNRVGGGMAGGASYQENKAKRRSEECPWPDSAHQDTDQGRSHAFVFVDKSNIVDSPDGSENMTMYGRGVGTRQLKEYESDAGKRSTPSESHFLLKLEELRNQLKKSNIERDNLAQALAESQEAVQEGADEILELEREVLDLQRLGTFIELLLSFSMFVKCIIINI